MVLNNVTKFQKNSDQNYATKRKETLLGVSYVPTEGRTGVRLNALAIVMAGA